MMTFNSLRVVKGRLSNLLCLRLLSLVSFYPYSSSDMARASHYEPVPMEGLHGLPNHGSSPFVPRWNLHTES